jgi:hypothetical protein
MLYDGMFLLLEKWKAYNIGVGMWLCQLISDISEL